MGTSLQAPERGGLVTCPSGSKPGRTRRWAEALGIFKSRNG